ncbi:UNVERIFIED_CONTAM: hypothetical protein GTU68_002771 [Idotea baltica]|nr:hypothetical protein [Idotea baltica]
MYDVLSSLLGMLKVDPISTDNMVFRLHYKATMFILITFSLLVTQKQYFGDPIDCISDSNVDLMDTFCWIQSTFTLPQVKNGIYAGVHNSNGQGGEPLQRRYHSYYQWVTLFLYLQALMFYIPRYLWKLWEGGKLKMLIDGLHLPILDEAEAESRKQFLVSFVRNNLRKQDSYAYKFFFCEILNFVNIIAQIFITDAFVGYEFTEYGTKVLTETQKTFVSRHDALEFVFPKVTKCLYKNIGPSGTPQLIDAICILPLNVFNEKLYIFLWFW